MQKSFCFCQIFVLLNTWHSLNILATTIYQSSVPESLTLVVQRILAYIKYQSPHFQRYREHRQFLMKQQVNLLKLIRLILFLLMVFLIMITQQLFLRIYPINKMKLHVPSIRSISSTQYKYLIHLILILYLRLQEIE